MASIGIRRVRTAGSRRSAVQRAVQLVLAFLISAVASVAAASVSGPHGSIELLSEQTALQLGLPFWVGLHFQLERGWHIYWINPGDSGEPLRVKWRLPAGFQAGPLDWPIPQRIPDHSLIDYGYLNEVLLPVKMTPPATLKRGPDVQLAATVSWLICREICVPAHADISLSLPVRERQLPQSSPARGLFAGARNSLPRTLPKSWKVIATVDQHRFILDIETGKREASAAFFPLDQIQIENAVPQKVVPSPRGVELQIQRSDQLLKDPPQMRGVLVLSNRGYEIEVPVRTSK